MHNASFFFFFDVGFLLLLFVSLFVCFLGGFVVVFL